MHRYVSFCLRWAAFVRLTTLLGSSLESLHSRDISLQARIPTPTDKEDASHTAGKMSKGAELPAAALTVATVVGIS